MQEKTILGHLKDIKKITIRITLVLLAAFTFFAFFSQEVFHFLLSSFNLQNLQLVFKNIQGGVTTKLKIAFNTSMVIMMPYIFLEMMVYLKGAFRFKVAALWCCMTLLYFLALVITYLVILPKFINFLLNFGFFGVNFYLDVSDFTGFIMQVILAFCFIFQIPVVIIMLIKLNVLSVEFLQKKRKVMFVLSFVFGAILTPPDALSQVVAAGIIYFFYEASIVAVKVIRR